MVAIRVALYLLGTINAFTIANPLDPTEIVIEKHLHPEIAEKLTGLQPGFPPFISNFMQHGTNVFFKPQFMLNPSYVAPGQGMIFENKEDCKKFPMVPAIPFMAQPEIVMDEPVKVVETIASDVDPPMLDKVILIKPPGLMLPEISNPPMVISPMPAITEELAIPDLPVSSPIVFSNAPELPELPVIPVLENVAMEQIHVEPVAIPAAPELPSFELPQAPLVYDVPVDEHYEAVQPAVIEEFKPVLIPEVPELPPLPEITLPSLPSMPEPVSFVETYDNIMPFDIPEAPQLPFYSPPDLPVPVVIPEIKECDKQNETQLVVEGIEPMIIPLPPVLSPPAEFPLDVIVSQPAFEPNVLVEINEKPLDIPPAPVLPEFDMPKLPMLMDIPVSETFTIPEEPTIIEEVNPAVPIALPCPPELPPMSIPDLPKIPAPPVLSPMTPFSFPEIPTYTAVEQELVSNEIPFVEVPEYVSPVGIPEAPLLHVPEMPSSVTVEEIKVTNDAWNIPAGPELPPMPIQWDEPMAAFYPPAELTPMIIEESKLPLLEVPNRPLFMAYPEPPKVSMSEVESVISFPTKCVKNIVIERVLPNIVNDGRVVSSSSYPVLSPYSPTLGIRLY